MNEITYYLGSLYQGLFYDCFPFLLQGSWTIYFTIQVLFKLFVKDPKWEGLGRRFARTRDEMKNQDEKQYTWKEKRRPDQFWCWLSVMGVSPWICLTCCTFHAAGSYLVFIKSSHVGMRKGKSCELKTQFLEMVPNFTLTSQLHSDWGETGIRGVELRSKDRVTLHFNLLPSNNWCYPICIYVLSSLQFIQVADPYIYPAIFKLKMQVGAFSAAGYLNIKLLSLQEPWAQTRLVLPLHIINELGL